MKRRAFLSMMLPAAAAAGLYGCGFKPFYFIQIADTQIGMIAGGEDGNEFTQETTIMENVISRINKMRPRPAFVVVCGDMTNIPAHEKQVAEYKRLMGLLDRSIPFYTVSGNHDFLGNQGPSHEGIAVYRKIYGPDWYSFTKGGWKFMVLNSTLMKTPDFIMEDEAAQGDWMEAEFADISKKNRYGTIVFMHHPFFDNSIDEEDGYHAITQVSRELYLEEFVKGNVRAAFSGHRHTTIPERAYKTVRLINTNAICNSFDNNPGLRVVKLYEGTLKDEFYHRDAIPERVEL